MPVMNFDLEDGQPHISFTLKALDAERFMAFLRECHEIKQSAKSPWISVDDRLPNKGQGVIAFRPTAPETNDPLFTITHFSGVERESWQGVMHKFDCVCHPTHWMPLPKAPAAKNTADDTTEKDTAPRESEFYRVLRSVLVDQANGNFEAGNKLNQAFREVEGRMTTQQFDECMAKAAKHIEVRA